jgi:HPt (histidine-containing phosphotransfer) domain-containing protein
MKKPKRERTIAEQYINNLMTSAGKDENLLFLTARVKNFYSVMEARIEGLRSAISQGDTECVAEVAHEMTQDTGKVGAIKMMRLCIALQMLGRRGLLDNAENLMDDLVKEYEQVKEGLISTTA